MGCYKEIYTPARYTPAVIKKWYTKNNETSYWYTVGCFCNSFLSFIYYVHSSNGYVDREIRDMEASLCFNGTHQTFVVPMGSYGMYEDWRLNGTIPNMSTLLDFYIAYTGLDYYEYLDYCTYKVFEDIRTDVSVRVYEDDFELQRSDYCVSGRYVEPRFQQLYSCGDIPMSGERRISSGSITGCDCDGLFN